MILRKAYQEIMDQVEMTEDMRSRILQNISGAKREEKPKTLPFPVRKALAAAAACLALLIGAFSLQGLNPFRPVPSTEQAGPVFDVVECRSAEELSEKAGFAVEEPQLPFEVTGKTYCILWGELAQIEYSAAEETIVYRVSRGTGDNSGDYNTYGDVVQRTVNGTSVTLKGNNGGFSLALWQKDGLSCSISTSVALTREQMLEMIP